MVFLFIDNYDSFTYNLVHYLQMLGKEVVVYRNDAINVADCLALRPSGIVISPGPCTPNEAGITLDLIQAAAAENLPLLGVCLGHQAIGQVFSGKVIRAPQPVHGRTSTITHNGQEIFAHVPSPCTVTRYHSLVVERDTLPDTLTITAETDGLIMAMRHRHHPLFGVQFHPESIASHYGHQMLQNFCSLALGQALQPCTLPPIPA
jgi:anthranilate synthase/aminodeoxychorismate synthase-like glutamine amidotransferase